LKIKLLKIKNKDSKDYFFFEAFVVFFAVVFFAAVFFAAMFR
jgi:hypothetical protein